MKKTVVIVALLLGVLLVVGGIGGTVAYLTAEDTVVKEFEGTVVGGTVEGDTVSAIAVKNEESSGIPVYVRVCVTVNYTYTVNGEGTYYCADTPETSADIAANPFYRNGKPRDIDYAYIVNSTDWMQGGDGFFYYKKPLQAGSTTAKLFDSFTIEHATHTVDGMVYYFTVETACEVIQCEDPTKIIPGNTPAVVQAWAVTLKDGPGSDLVSAPEADFDPYS